MKACALGRRSSNREAVGSDPLEGHMSPRRAGIDPGDALSIAGFAVFLAVFEYSTSWGLPWLTFVDLAFPDMILYRSAIITLVAAVTILLLIRIHRRPQPPSSLCKLYALFSLLALASAVIMRFHRVWWPAANDQAVCALGSALIGSASGGLLMLWAQRICTCGSHFGVARTALYSSALFIGIATLTLAVPITRRLCLLVVCIAASFLLYCMSVRDIPLPAKDESKGDPSSEDLGILSGLLLSLRPALLIIAALSFPFGLVRGSTLTSTLGDMWLIDFAEVASCIGVWLVFALGCLVTRKRPRVMEGIGFVRLSHVLFPIIAALAASMTFMDATMLRVDAAILDALNLAVLMLVVFGVMTPKELSQADQVASFALTCSTLFFSRTASYLLVFLVYTLGGTDPTTISTCASIALYTVAMIFIKAQAELHASQGRHQEQSAPPPMKRPVIVAEDLKRKCSIIQERYDLTGREADILELSMRGYTLEGMAEKLVVSQNTVRSHSRNLYRKLDVHSRSQILDLLENVE